MRAERIRNLLIVLEKQVDVVADECIGDQARFLIVHQIIRHSSNNVVEADLI
jgi:hypothetical protein